MNIKQEIIEDLISSNNLPSFEEIDLFKIKHENTKTDAKQKRKEKMARKSETTTIKSNRRGKTKKI